MSMFGWSLVKTEELDYLRGLNIRTHALYRWFAGWQDLEVIWNFLIKADRHYPGWSPSMCRVDYAKARNTDEYGKRLDSTVEYDE